RLRCAGGWASDSAAAVRRWLRALARGCASNGAAAEHGGDGTAGGAAGQPFSASEASSAPGLGGVAAGLSAPRGEAAPEWWGGDLPRTALGSGNRRGGRCWN